MPLELARVGAAGAGIAAKAAKAAASPASSFADSLNQMIEKVEDSQADANSSVVNMLDGNGEVHDAMIALQNAEMTLQFTVQVRNKLVSAYQDIMRMPI